MNHILSGGAENVGPMMSSFRDQNAVLENAGPENAGPENAALENA